MKRKWLESIVLSALMGAGSLALQAQEVVHAVTGTVTAVDPAKNSITIKTNDGSEGDFQYEKPLKARIEFDKSVREGTTDPGAFNKVGARVIAYYFLGPSGRIIVGLKDFGSTQLSVASGTLVGEPKHRQITVKTDAGATETFEIAKDASAETSEGVISGLKLNANGGTHVTVRFLDNNGTKVAQYVRTD